MGLTNKERARRERAEERYQRALHGPAVSWAEMREAIEAAEDEVNYAMLLACRRADDFAVKEARALRRTAKKAARKAFGTSQVYVIKRKGARLIKIGVTTNVKRRMRALAAAGGGELELLVSFPGTREDEQALHARFAEHRRQGEWFEYARPLQRWVHERKGDGRMHA